MTNTATKEVHDTTRSLDLAGGLTLPSREAMLTRSPAVQRFWDDNAELLKQAWQEWEMSDSAHQPALNDNLLDAKLREAVLAAWQNPQQESAVKALWTEALPGVYQCQFFDANKLKALRSYLEDIASAGIPLRPPYGIALNRRGAMLDTRSQGCLATPAFQAFYQELMDKYMRPIARMLFPEIMGYDSQTFGFSIQYQPGMDTSLQPHTDASSATLNINLNLPHEDFTGSEVDFFDRKSGAVERLTFKPGMAMLHRGNIAHAAQPIKSGERTNMVLWLYGDHMQIPRPGITAKSSMPQERWSVPRTKPDHYAPF